LVYCSACGAQISPQAIACPQCGHPNAVNPAATGQAKSRTTAGILAILLGSLGVHKFYLGKIGSGILYLCFSFTGVPGVIGIIEGIVYLTQTDQAFAQAQGVRTV
jgi:TM2 domain-containing membrane protein YozV